MSITNQAFAEHRAALERHHDERRARQGELTVDSKIDMERYHAARLNRTVAYDTMKPDLRSTRTATDRRHHQYSTGYRDGFARALREWRRGFTQAEVDRWFNGPLSAWVEGSKHGDPVPEMPGIPKKIAKEPADGI